MYTSYLGVVFYVLIAALSTCAPTTRQTCLARIQRRITEEWLGKWFREAYTPNDCGGAHIPHASYHEEAHGPDQLRYKMHRAGGRTGYEDGTPAENQHLFT